jgi:hypothetical protein
VIRRCQLLPAFIETCSSLRRARARAVALVCRAPPLPLTARRAGRPPGNAACSSEQRCSPIGRLRPVATPMQYQSERYQVKRHETSNVRCNFRAEIRVDELRIVQQAASCHVLRECNVEFCGQFGMQNEFSNRMKIDTFYARGCVQASNNSRCVILDISNSTVYGHTVRPKPTQVVICLGSTH